MSASNTGKPFEHRMETVLAQYSSKGLMRLKKVDPPTKIIGRKVIFLENPFLDYAGSWTEASGRSVFCECKSTKEPVLPILSAGLNENQIRSLLKWHYAGSACFTLWDHAGNVYYIGMRKLIEKIHTGVRNFKPAECELVGQGTGFILFDFIKNMRQDMLGG